MRIINTPVPKRNGAINEEAMANLVAAEDDRPAVYPAPSDTQDTRASQGCSVYRDVTAYGLRVPAPISPVERTGMRRWTIELLIPNPRRNPAI